MIGQITGKVHLNEHVLYSDYHWGPLSEVEGATLDLLEENQEGACLCLVTVNGQRKGLMDVDPRDIRRVERTKQTAHSLMDLLDTVLREMQQEGVL